MNWPSSPLPLSWLSTCQQEGPKAKIRPFLVICSCNKMKAAKSVNLFKNNIYRGEDNLIISQGNFFALLIYKLSKKYYR